MTNYSFNPIDARNKLVEEIKKHAERVVVGISGGKDSTIVAALCVRALGKENVYGVMLPDGEQKDIDDSIKICKILGIPHTTVNIYPIHTTLNGSINFANNQHSTDMAIPFSKDADINVVPRIRMTVLRYITQALNARLAGTGNLSEATVGYCTKDGDTSCDFSVLGGLTSKEVIQIGLVMDELPQELVLKTPSDGLCGMTDEEKLGVSYEDIHHYIRGDSLIDSKAYRIISTMESNSSHKRHMPRVLYNPVSLVLCSPEEKQ